VDNSEKKTIPRPSFEALQVASRAILYYFRKALLKPLNVNYSVDKRWIKST